MTRFQDRLNRSTVQKHGLRRETGQYVADIGLSHIGLSHCESGYWFGTPMSPRLSRLRKDSSIYYDFDSQNTDRIPRNGNATTVSFKCVIVCAVLCSFFLSTCISYGVLRYLENSISQQFDEKRQESRQIASLQTNKQTDTLFKVNTAMNFIDFWIGIRTI